VSNGGHVGRFGGSRSGSNATIRGELPLNPDVGKSVSEDWEFLGKNRTEDNNAIVSPFQLAFPRIIVNPQKQEPLFPFFIFPRIDHRTNYKPV